MDIEIPIGTKLIINGVECEVAESRKCSDCEIKRATAYMFSKDGISRRCGTKLNSNTSWFACSKDCRSDKKDIIFKRIKK